MIASDPHRYRVMIIPAILEKASFGLAVAALWLIRGVPMPVLVGASIDVQLGGLFVLSWFAMGRTDRNQATTTARH